MIRATAAEGQIRAFAVTSKELVEEARKRHNTSPIVTAALGRLMSGAVMMGSMMKGEKDLLTIRVNGDGPMRGMTVTADAAGNVKGYPFVPDVVLPANALGKLGQLDDQRLQIDRLPVIEVDDHRVLDIQRVGELLAQHIRIIQLAELQADLLEFVAVERRNARFG